MTGRDPYTTRSKTGRDPYTTRSKTGRDPYTTRSKTGSDYFPRKKINLKPFSPTCDFSQPLALPVHDSGLSECLTLWFSPAQISRAIDSSRLRGVSRELLYNVLAPSLVSAAGRKCGYIYKGFAECLLRLGDSMTESMQQGGEELLEIDSVCRSWDEFHRCASAALAGCPDEAAVVWESLRQESRKMQFSGNLYDMCSNRAKPSTSVQNPNQEETNQESLRGSAYLPGPAHLLALSLAALVVRM
ncbi:NRN1L protein, partial [Polyodon spathula]|nr:NRN1L protein [Polyodon spathula]